jgi:hypothetical protein
VSETGTATVVVQVSNTTTANAQLKYLKNNVGGNWSALTGTVRISILAISF